MKRFAGWLLVALALGSGAGSCSSIGPVAGLLTVSLATPNAGADGAILFNVSGPQALTSVTAGPGLRVFSQPLSTSTRFAVSGTLTSGAVVTIGVADTRTVAQYTATVQAVAAPDFQLRSLTGYSLTVSR
jgi:hypothetical protein